MKKHIDTRKVGDEVVMPNKQYGIITRISNGKARVEMGDTMQIVPLSDLTKFAEMTGSIDTMPKNTLPPSEECEIGFQEPLVSNDLKEASSKFATHTANGVSVEFLHEKLAFQEGARWQKEKMMKEAVDSGMTVGDINRKLWYVPEDFKVVFFKEGDKVKLIIVKED